MVLSIQRIIIKLVKVLVKVAQHAAAADLAKAQRENVGMQF
jgi:hypothetical protein